MGYRSDYPSEEYARLLTPHTELKNPKISLKTWIYLQSSGKLDVSMVSEAYDARVKNPNRKFRLNMLRIFHLSGRHLAGNLIPLASRILEPRDWQIGFGQ
jgi:hypothetical protein